jgi:glycosyltransferase involved in cell wall biosynthesis
VRAAIIIPCYNYGRFLPAAIESALAQTRAADEIIVVDDGSTDDSLKVAQSYGVRDGVRVLACRHAGAASAKAAGIAASTADCFTVLDADDCLAPTYLEKTIPILQSNPEVALVYTAVTRFGATEGFEPVRPFSRARLMGANYIHGTALTRRAAYDRAGGYGPLNLPKYEDWHLFLTMVEQGWRAAPIAETVLYYRQHVTSRNRTAGPDHEQAVRAVIFDHPRIFRPSPRLWYALHRHVFRRFPRLYLALAMIVCALPTRQALACHT